MKLAVYFAIVFTSFLSVAQTPVIPGSDVFITVRNSPPDQPQSLPTDCRAHIADIVCLVESTQTPQDPMTRTCLPGSRDYARFFQGHFDRSNPLIQNMYCHLERLFIENQFFATAYATLIVDSSKKVIGGAI